MKLSWLFIIAVIAFVAIFSVQNAAPITVRLLAWEFSLSAALAIQLAALLGGWVGLVCGWYSGRMERRRKRSDEPGAPGSELPPGQP